MRIDPHRESSENLASDASSTNLSIFLAETELLEDENML
jgi:hypothetical protein